MKLVFCLLCLSPFLVFAENHLVYFGGGSPDDTQFDYTLKTLLNYSNSKKWQSDFYSKAKLPSDISEADSRKINYFSQESFNKKIRQLKADMDSGKITNKDQLMLVIDTHGNIDPITKKTYLTVDGQRVEMQELEHLIKMAEKKGVKLALISGNCYGGGLLAFGSKKTCVVSASPADKVAYGSFLDWMTHYTNSPPKNKNLEQVFLKARRQISNPEKVNPTAQDPQISTEAGQTTNEYLAVFKNAIQDKIDIEKNLTSSPTCKNFSVNLPLLRNKIYEMQKAINGGLLHVAPAKYQNLLNSLKIQMDKYSELYNQTQELKVEENFIRQKVEALPDGSSPAKSTLLDLNDYIHSRLETKKAAMVELSKTISRDEKILYDGLYRYFSSQSNKPNPCRNFKL